MEYVKTFVMLAIFIFLSVGCIANMIIHRDERKEKRLQEKEEKRLEKLERKQAKAEKKWKRRAQMMGIELLSDEELKEAAEQEENTQE